MPKLGEYQYLLDVCFFAYPDRDSAVAGTGFGGSGFFVALPSRRQPDKFHHIYAVTNWHVVVNGASVIRVNRKLGGVATIDLEPHEWIFLPDFHDIAVAPVNLNASELKVEAISADSFFLTDKDIAQHEVNAGDDIFMVGRFLDHDGTDTNKPALRFGHISQMGANVKQPTGYVGPSIVVDMHSRTGFSGSPVFVYRTPGSIFSKANTIMGGGHFLKLLGILWGQFPENWKFAEVGPQPRVPAGAAAQSVLGWSGMSLVCPAAAIQSVLDFPELVAKREAVEKSL